MSSRYSHLFLQLVNVKSIAFWNSAVKNWYVPVAFPPMRLKLHCSFVFLSKKICEYAYRKSRDENNVCLLGRILPFVQCYRIINQCSASDTCVCE